MASKRFDWEYWRQKYVSGPDALTLEALSQIPDAPSLPTLKKRSMNESWAEQRKQFRYQVSTKVSQDDTLREAVEQTSKLIDVAELITRHVRLARSFQEKIVSRLELLDPDELRPSDLINWLKISTDIERLANGLATETSNLVSSDNSMTPSKIVRVVVDPKTSLETEY